MTPKEKLLALAVTFSIITEGLTAPQLQEALDANAGYQAFLAKDKELEIAVEAAERADAKIAELEGDLRAANKTAADLQTELDQANETIEALAAKAEENTTGPEKILFTDLEGNTYEIIQSLFRFKGKEYQSAKAVVEHPEVLQELVEAKAFILKKQ